MQGLNLVGDIGAFFQDTSLTNTQTKARTSPVKIYTYIGIRHVTTYNDRRIAEMSDTAAATYSCIALYKVMYYPATKPVVDCIYRSNFKILKYLQSPNTRHYKFIALFVKINNDK